MVRDYKMLNYQYDQTKKQIITCFNKGANTYDRAANVQTHIGKCLALRLSGIPASRVLEIGCGTGLFSQHLSELFSNASLLLTDVAPAMVDICKQRFINQSNVRVVCMDGENLMLSNQFDLITSNMTLHWFSHLQRNLKNIINKLISNGHFIFSMLGENSLQEWRHICKKFKIANATPVFPTKDFIKKIIPTAQIHVETYQQKYKSAYAFLNSLKLIGATAAPLNYIPLSAGMLRRVMRHFDTEITISYEVIYGYYKKA